MKSLNKIYIVAILAFMVTSCFKDDGNYTYKDLSLNGEITGIEENYDVLFQDNLSITPTIKWDDAEPAAYEWSYYKSGYNAGAAQIISTDKDLNIDVNIPQGTYIFRYRVIAKDGRFTEKISNITISSAFSKGFYVLKELKDNKSDMDLFRPNGTELRNAYYSTNNEHLNGVPEGLFQQRAFSHISPVTKLKTVASFIVPVTDQGFRYINLNDNSILYDDLGDLFYDSSLNDEKLVAAVDLNYFSCLFTNKSQAFSYGQGGRPTSSGFFIKSNFAELNGENITFNPSDKVNIASNLVLMWDDVAKRFLVIMSSASGNIKVSSFDEKDNPEVPLNDLIGWECKYIASCSSLISYGAYSMLSPGLYPIMKHNGKTYVYSIAGARNTPADLKKLATRSEVDPSLKLNNAEFFASNGLGTKLFYYLVDNQVYSYNIDEKIENLLTFEGLNTGDEITGIGTIFRTKELVDSFDYLYVMTYNASEDKYTVSFYNTEYGEPVGAPVKKFTGEGRGKAVQYVSGDQNKASIRNYSVNM